MTRKVIFVPDDYWTNPPQENQHMSDHPRRSPRDVVAFTQPTRKQILEWNAMVGTAMPVSQPGDFKVDSDGTPLSVGPSSTAPELIGALPVYADQLTAAGLTPDDVPNLIVYHREGH